METIGNFYPPAFYQPEESIAANQFIPWQCDQQANDIIAYRDGAFDTSVADSIEKGLLVYRMQGKLRWNKVKYEYLLHVAEIDSKLIDIKVVIIYCRPA